MPPPHLGIGYETVLVAGARVGIENAVTEELERGESLDVKALPELAVRWHVDLGHVCGAFEFCGDLCVRVCGIGKLWPRLVEHPGVVTR